ncbi:AraC family transcriptional regulator [Aquibacillus koreensis]|uniref:AraC family transcriptional regulator n=1 Tax=Aquibacillus koreensis TaxID=279446 RepID=A0A9X3WQV9_9BACI|nr:AraC family transcriptional regulator [Aquibacillus koreensis]MCT2536872.1 AraC family transcriptional regulator [Aquibacillus koreensis]MDC3421996.1 AraC family transcriptional regulator [Aquibacillus koreensis]
MRHILQHITNTFSLDHTIIESPFNIDTHIHDCYEIFYFISGDLTYYIEGQAYKLSPHDIIITNTRELHRIVFDSSACYERKYIQFKPEFISSFQTDDYNMLHYMENRKLGKFNKISAADVREAGIDQLWSKIEENALVKSPENQILMKTYFIQLLVSINKIFSKYNSPVVERPKYDEKIVHLLEYINNNLDKRISLDLLQDKFFVNKFYLSHSFKKTTGFAVMEYITYKRIMWAIDLIMDGTTALDASHTVGFGDYSTFYKAFKNTTGMSPRQYCKQ